MRQKFWKTKIASSFIWITGVRLWNALKGDIKFKFQTMLKAFFISNYWSTLKKSLLLICNIYTCGSLNGVSLDKVIASAVSFAYILYWLCLNVVNNSNDSSQWFQPPAT